MRKVQPLLDNATTKTVFIDVFSSKTQHDFLEKFAASVIQQTESRAQEWLRVARKFLANMTPSLEIAADPSSDFRLSLKLHNAAYQPDDILNLPQKIAKDTGCKIIVMIDEFQQIAEYPDSLSFQRQLRTVWQHQQDVTYCLFGSKQHLMQTLFENSNCPFFKFGDFMFLKRIETKDWIPFIVDRFAKTGKTISESNAEKIVLATEGLSSYVQQLAWIVWYKAQCVVQDTDIDAAIEDLIDQTSNFFQSMIDGLTKNQFHLLRAIASGETTGLTRMELIRKYDLVNSSVVLQARDALIKKDLITVDGRNTTINDPVLKRWILTLR